MCMGGGGGRGGGTYIQRVRGEGRGARGGKEGSADDRRGDLEYTSLVRTRTRTRTEYLPTTIGLYKCCAGQHVGIATVSVNLGTNCRQMARLLVI